MSLLPAIDASDIVQIISSTLSGLSVTSPVGGLPTPQADAGFVLLTRSDGSYLTRADGTYLQRAA